MHPRPWECVCVCMCVAESEGGWGGVGVGAPADAVWWWWWWWQASWKGAFSVRGLPEGSQGPWGDRADGGRRWRLGARGGKARGCWQAIVVCIVSRMRTTHPTGGLAQLATGNWQLATGNGVPWPQREHMQMRYACACAVSFTLMHTQREPLGAHRCTCTCTCTWRSCALCRPPPAASDRQPLPRDCPLTYRRPHTCSLSHSLTHSHTPTLPPPGFVIGPSLITVNIGPPSSHLLYYCITPPSTSTYAQHLLLLLLLLTLPPSPPPSTAPAASATHSRPLPLSASATLGTRQPCTLMLLATCPCRTRPIAYQQ